MNINATIFAQIISFIIFVVFCMKYVWPPLISVIEKRQKEISDAFSSVEQAKKKSDILKSEADDYLKRAKNESKSIIDGANEYRLQLISQAKFEAESEKTKILTQAYEEISYEKKRVLDELQEQISSLVMCGVEKVIERSLDKSDDYNIIDKVLRELNIVYK